MRSLFLVWGVLIFAPSQAEAQRSVPAGEGWWCTTTTLFNMTESSLCTRTESGCERYRESWLQDQDELSSAAASACEPQAKATVLYFFSVMHDEDRRWVHGHMAHCRFMRTQLLKLKGDVTRVSACTVVGSTKPAKPRATLIPKGK